MYLKFFARGTGGGTGPVDYCCDQIVSKFDPITRRRINGEFVTRDPAPVIVSGDKNRTRSLIDSIDNKWKYTSGVLAFAVDDNPSEADQLAVIDDFEKIAFAGLDKDQYNILWIRHEHEGNVELHYVSPRVELSTGKALNIAPPGYQDLFNAVRDKWNYSKGWASPDEPDRKKLVQQDDHVAKMDAALLKANLPKSNDPKRLITEFLLQRLEAGLLTNRDDVISALKDAEIDINRQGKDYISVRPEPGAKPIRLKGVLYDQQFEASFDRAAAIRDELGFVRGSDEGKNSGGSWRNPSDDAKRVTDATTVIDRIVRSRHDFNQKRYCSPEPRHADVFIQPERRNPEIAGQQHITDSEQIKGIEIDAGGGREQAREIAGNWRGADQYTEREVSSNTGDEQRQDHRVSRQDDSNSQQPADSFTQRDQEANQAVDVADESADIDFSVGSPSRLPDSVARDLGLPSDRAFYNQNSNDDDDHRKASSDHFTRLDNVPDGGERSSIPVQKTRLAIFFETIRGIYDTTRNAIADGITGTWQAICNANDRLEQSSQQLVHATANANTSYEQSDQHLIQATANAVATGERTQQVKRDFDQAIERGQQGVSKMIQNNTDEIARFKLEINLVEYAESKGYVKDKRESSRCSTLMRMGGVPGADKIIIATDQDGHGIYCSVRDDSDNGTIIDFVQKRLGLNLGQVRKELRPWVGASPTIERKPEADRPAKPTPSTVDIQNALIVFNQFSPAAGEQVYLEDERGITTATLKDPRFINRIRIDAMGNAVFPHYDRNGFCGFELKNDGFTGFSKGGVKALWQSSNLGDASKIVICEGTIDALSHAQMFPDPDCAYVSTAGTPSKEQLELIQALLIDAHGRGVEVVIGTDNDDGGDKLAEKIQDLTPVQLERHLPKKTGDDWNQQLTNQIGRRSSYEMMKG